MDYVVTDRKVCLSVVAFLCLLSVVCCSSGNAVRGLPQLSGEGGVFEPGIVGEGGGGFSDPARIYKSCKESYRLDQTGDLHLPPETTLESCTGPCLRETNFVLGCKEGVLTNFLFYNRPPSRMFGTQFTLAAVMVVKEVTSM